LFMRSWSAIIGTKQRKVVGNILRLETCMNSLVKVPPYSKLNVQGNIFFTQNCCNIKIYFKYIQSFIFSTGHHFYIQASKARNLCERLDYYLVNVCCFNLYCFIHFNLKDTAIFSCFVHFYH
jgi:hypothetical protein